MAVQSQIQWTRVKNSYSIFCNIKLQQDLNSIYSSTAKLCIETLHNDTWGCIILKVAW